MNSAEDLQSSFLLYNKQLEDVKAALEKAGPEEYAQLESLKATIEELLELTKQSLNSECDDGNTEMQASISPPPPVSHEDPLDAEYALFKAELAELGSAEKDSLPNNSDGANEPTQFDEANTADLQEELDELVGSKCQAPYTDRLNVVHHYNALVLSVSLPDAASQLEHIQVRVMFINPTEKDMVPCPFYLDGRCKFSDSKCNYSHGYLVPLSQLKEYRDPDFSLVKAGCSVLARLGGGDSELWVSTRVEEVLSVDTVSVKHGGLTHNVPLHHILPLSGFSSPRREDWSPEEGEESNWKDEAYDESEEVSARLGMGLVSEAAVERSLLNPEGFSSRLGDWEKHTRGIGSKLMAKMGYVVGAGLGRKGEGIIHPVQAQVLPPGKSLDHCMELREAAGSSGKDLFSVEKLQKKLALRAQRRSQQIYKKKVQEEQNNVFTIINSMTASKQQVSGDDKKSDQSFKKQLESSSERWLNVEKVKTEENMEKIVREMFELRNRLSTKKEGTTEFRHLSSRLSDAKAKYGSLERRNGKIAWEIKTRDTKKKMAF